MALSLAILEFLLWLQPSATPGASGGGGAAASSAGGGGGLFGAGNMLMILGVIAITYFFVLRPDAQRRKETEDMQKGLQKGMKVRTSGGILGEIVSIGDRDVTLAIADKVRINVLRENIRGPEVEAKPAETKKEPAAAAATEEKK